MFGTLCRYVCIKTKIISNVKYVILKSQDNHQNTKKKMSSYFYFSQPFKPKTQRDRNTTTVTLFLERRTAREWKKVVRPHTCDRLYLRCRGHRCYAVQERQPQQHEAQLHACNKHCTHKHRRACAHFVNKVSSVFFQGWAPAYTQPPDVSALRVGRRARGRDVKPTNTPR